MTNLIFDQTDGEKAQPMSIAKTNEDFNKKQPFPKDPDLGEHTPLVEIPNISDNTIEVSDDNSEYPHSLFIPQNPEVITNDPNNSYITFQLNNKLFDDNVFPEDKDTPISNHFVSSIGNSSRNEFSTD